jgi:hypothetical protein
VGGGRIPWDAKKASIGATRTRVLDTVASRRILAGLALTPDTASVSGRERQVPLAQVILAPVTLTGGLLKSC